LGHPIPGKSEEFREVYDNLNLNRCGHYTTMADSFATANIIPRTAIGEMVAATKGMGFRLNWAMGIRHRGGENGKEAEGGDFAVQGGAR
jgi:hypothetical protein